jgi:glutaredoxin
VTNITANVATSVAKSAAGIASETVRNSSTPYLFTTATCPNCKVATALLDRAGIKYVKVLADENVELALDLGIRQAPTLFVGNGADSQKFSGVSGVKQYIDEVVKAGAAVW